MPDWIPDVINFDCFDLITSYISTKHNTTQISHERVKKRHIKKYVWTIHDRLTNRGQVIKAFASHFSRTQARRPGSNLTTAIGPGTAHTRLTQPATFSETANQVPASAGVMARSSPLSGGK